MSLGSFNNIAIIGLGFMGIALAKSLKTLKNNFVINGYDINEDLSSFLLNSGIIDNNFIELNSLVKKSDVIFLTTPIIAFKDILLNIKDDLNNQILVDFGSVKNNVYNTISNILEVNKNLYVPLHTICGGRSINIKNNLESEIERINNNIFCNNVVHLFPEVSNKNNLDIIENIFNKLGSKIDKSLNLEEHDKVYALTSHLPTFLSFNFLLSLNNKNNKVYEYFKNKKLDSMWYSVFIDNIDNIKFWLDKINKNLNDKITANDLSNILKNIVINNNFENYVGNGYIEFIGNNNKEICCNLNNFIDNQRRLLSICENKNIQDLQNILLTI